MFEAQQLKARLSTMSGSDSWNVTPWVVFGLVLIAVIGIGLMYYRDWHVQKAWKRRPKVKHEVKPGSRVPGLSLAEVRRAKQAAKLVARKGDTGMLPTR